MKVVDNRLGARGRCISYDVPIEVGDGTAVRAMISLAEPAHPSPVLLMRTPYPWGPPQEMEALLRAFNFALVWVNVRGTGASDGDFDPWMNDIDDGRDVIEWCARQPWSTGEVVAMGGSYLGLTQLLAAGCNPESLKAMAINVCPSDMHSVFYRQGAFRLADMATWGAGRALEKVTRDVVRGRGEFVGDQRELAGFMGDPMEILSRLPLNSVEVMNQHFPYFRIWVENPDPNSDYWQARHIPVREAIPSIFSGGWHDIFLESTIAEFVKSQHAHSELVIGPWTHMSRGRTLGAVDYGPQASEVAIGMATQNFRFLQSHLSSSETKCVHDPEERVRVFLMGRNQWIHGPSWPIPGTVPRNLYFRPGTLSDMPADALPSTFRYDPASPVPTVGGPNLMPQGDAAGYAGSWDQAILDDRSDILRFSTEPLSNPLDVIGVAEVTLYASTTAVDTDWTVKLIDVAPNGVAINITDGIVRARYRKFPFSDELVPPGEIEVFTIRLAPTAYSFGKGHRLRLDVSSSNFPRFDRNPGTGAIPSLCTPESFVTSEQTVYHDEIRPSHLTLPVIDLCGVTSGTIRLGGSN